MIYAVAEVAVRRFGSVPLPHVGLPARLDVELPTADTARGRCGSRGTIRPRSTGPSSFEAR